MSIPAIDQLDPSQSGKEALINELFDALRESFTLGKWDSASAGLTIWFYGGRWAGTDVANQSLTLPASTSAIYIEADATSGAISQNTTSYTVGKVPLGIAVTSGSGLTSYTPESRTSGAAAGASLAAANVWTKNQSVAPHALTDGSSIATDASLSNNFTVTLGGNRTLANPTNLAAGMWLHWTITQDGTGSRTLAYGSDFKWSGGVAPTLSTAAGAVDTVSAYCNGSTLLATFLGGFS